MRLNPSVGFDDLFGKGGSRQDLCHEGIRIERNRSDQLLQLLGSLLRVWRALLGLRRSLRVLVLVGRQVLRPSRKQQRERQQGGEKLPAGLRSRIPRGALDDVHDFEPPSEVRLFRRLYRIDEQGRMPVAKFTISLTDYRNPRLVQRQRTEIVFDNEMLGRKKQLQSKETRHRRKSCESKTPET